MSAIRNALESLQQSVRGLEKSVIILEKTRVGEQRDMFAQSSGEGVIGAVSSELIAQRLDNAIEKVEQLLQEDDAA